MSVIGDLWGGLTGQTAADASRSAADTQAQYQREALNYLKQANAPALEARNFALGGLMDYYGGNQQGVVNQAMQSPFYQSMVGQGEEAILRNAAATGGLRSGGVQQALAQNSQNVLQSLVGQQLSGLGMLSGFNTGAENVANLTSGIGSTLAQGQVAGAQAQQAGLGNLLNTGLTAAAIFSDERLKDNVTFIGNKGAHRWYSWTWNKEAEKLGLHGESEGVIAQEVEKYAPEHVDIRNGYKAVNYEGLLNG